MIDRRIGAPSPTCNGKNSSRQWRRWVAVGVLCAAVQLGSPIRAYALFEWLDHLSGPGPFRGIEFQFKLFCLMDQPDPTTAGEAVLTARDLTERVFIEPSARREPGVSATLPLLPPSDVVTQVQQFLLNPLAVIRVAELQNLAVKTAAFADAVRVAAGPSEAERARVARAWDVAAQRLREAAVPRVTVTPGAVLWAACRDRPNRNGGTVPVLADVSAGPTPVPAAGVARRAERYPVFSVNLNYRYYTTGTFFFSGPSTSANYAHGRTIQLQVIQIQPSWPLTGRHDILDAQTGIGLYQFTSEDFPKLRGLILEPVRFDLHFPARLVDRNRNPFMKVLYSASFRWGWVNFPKGFAADDFNATGAAARDISGGEMVFEKGIVWNVGRLFGK